jgi:hypothetical protein
MTNSDDSTTTFICHGCRRRQERSEILLRLQKEKVDDCVDNTGPYGEAFILRLPDELISEIFDFAVTEPLGEWSRKYGYYGRALALTKVCKRFSCVIQPIQYRTIRFDNPCSLVPPCIPAKRFHRTIQAEPSLGRFCKELKIFASELRGVESANDYEIANEILCRFPNVTELNLQGGWNRNNRDALWSMVQRAVEHMPKLEKVTLRRENVRGLLLDPVIEHLTIPSLRTLEIDGMSSLPTNSGGENDIVNGGIQPNGVCFPS